MPELGNGHSSHDSSYSAGPELRGDLMTAE